MGKYDDIINLPHHVSQVHEHMSRIERAAQFAPFSALTGYDDAIEEEARVTDNRPVLDENMKSLLDERLHLALEEGKPVRVTSFTPDLRKDGGKLVTHTGKIQKCDWTGRILVMEDGFCVSTDDITDLVLTQES